MNQAIALGPLLLPVQALLLIAAVAAALLMLALLPQRAPGQSRRAEAWLFGALVAGVLGARLGWVALHPGPYLASPGSLLAFRDGGYSSWAGLLAAAFALALLVWWSARQRLRADALPLDKRGNSDTLPGPSQLMLPGMAALALLAMGQIGLALHARWTQQPLPQLTVLDMQGQPQSFPPAAGRPSVVNLWASWCGPCRREMPAFARVQARRVDVDFIYLNIGESVEEVQAFLRTLAQPIGPIWMDPQQVVPLQLGVRGYPTTFVFDAEGQLRHTRMGELSEASLEALVGPVPQ